MSSAAATVAQQAGVVGGEAGVGEVRLELAGRLAQQAAGSQEGAGALGVAVEVVDAEGDRPAGAEVVAPPHLGDAGPEEGAEVAGAGDDVVVPHRRRRGRRRARMPLERLGRHLDARVEEQDEVGRDGLEAHAGAPRTVRRWPGARTRTWARPSTSARTARLSASVATVVDDHDLEGPVGPGGGDLEGVERAPDPAALVVGWHDHAEPRVRRCGCFCTGLCGGQWRGVLHGGGPPFRRLA